MKLLYVTIVFLFVLGCGPREGASPSYSLNDADNLENSADMVVAGKLKKHSRADGTPFLFDSIRPEDDEYNEEHLERIFGAHQNTVDCNYTLDIKMEDKTKTLSLTRGEFLDGDVQKTPDELAFFDWETKTEFSVNMFSRGTSLTDSIKVTSTCISEEHDSCIAEELPYQLNAKCTETDETPTTAWKSLAVHRNIGLEESEWDQNGEGEVAETTKTNWQGQVFPDDHYFNKKNFADLSHGIKKATALDQCEFRLRFLEWGANVTRSNAASENPSKAFFFKGSSFVTSDHTIFPEFMERRETQDEHRHMTELRFTAPGQTVRIYSFHFIFWENFDDDVELEQITSRSTCYRGNSDQERTQCEDEFHYYSMEYRCQ